MRLCMLRFACVWALCAAATAGAATNPASLFDDFDPALDAAQWFNVNGVANTSFAASSPLATGNSLWFDSSATRSATTIALDVTNPASVISFSLNIGQTTTPTEHADPGEDIVLEYSTDNINFIIINTYLTTVVTTWTRFSVPVPAAARTAGTFFRWRQILHSGVGFDEWALDNVSIGASTSSPLTVTVNQAATQNDPTLVQPINFTAIFSAAVTNFTSASIALSGNTAGAVASVTGTGTTYNIAISGLTNFGTLSVSIPAGVVADAGFNFNQASTSTDNSVTIQAANVRTWTGGSATSDNWSDPANWGGNTIVAGDALVFGGTTRLTPFNDLPAGTSFLSISFNSPNFVLSGHDVTLTGTLSPCVTNNAASATVNLKLQAGGSVASNTGLPGLQFNGGLQLSGALQFLTGTYAVNSAISGTGLVTVIGTVSYTVPQLYTSGTSVSGTLTLGAASVIPTAGTCTLQAGSTLSLAQDQTIPGGISGSGTITTTAPNGVTWTDSSALAETFSGTISGLINYEKTGTGTMTFSGTGVNYTGTVKVSGGTLSLGSATGLGSNATANIGGQVQITPGTFSAPLVLNGGTLWALNTTTVGTISITAPSTIRADNTFTASTQGTGFTKTGVGTLILGNSSIVSGTVTVGSGILSLGNVNLATPITVNVGGTLAGTGTIGNVTLNGGILAPSPGLLNVGNLSASAASNLRFTVNGAAAFSQLGVIGTANLANITGTVTGTGVNPGQPLTVLLNDGTDPIAAFPGVKEGGVISTTYRVSYLGGTGNDLVLNRILTASPAPLKFNALILELPTIFENDTAVVNGDISTQFPGSPITVTIDWGDGSPVEIFTRPAGTLTFSAPHVYPDDKPKNTIQDTFTINATLFDGTYIGSGSTAVVVKDVRPENLVLGLSKSTIDEGGSVTLNGTFTDAGLLDTHAVTIKWGDSKTDTLSLPASTLAFSMAHTYADDGLSIAPADVYAIDVTVADDDTGTVQASTSVTVNNVAPQITSASIASLNEGEAATLDVSFSDPNPADGFTITVDWNDGSPLQIFQKTSASTAFSTTHAYADNAPGGNYNVLVQIQDKDGGGVFYNVEANVKNVKPALSLTLAPETIHENEPVSLGGTVTDPGVNDAVSVSVDWGDGSPSEAVPLAASAFSVTHSYVNDMLTGAFSITVTATDKDGGSTTATKTVTVLNAAPHVSVTNMPNNAFVAEGSTLALTATVDDPGALDTFVYAWQVLKNGQPYATGAAASLAVTLNDDGVYDISLSVTDNAGAASNTLTGRVTAFNVKPTVTIDAPAGAVAAGVPLTLTPNITDPGSTDTFSYSWLVLVNGAPIAISTENALTFTPPADGNYIVQLTVTDDDGSSGLAQVPLTAAGPVVASAMTASPNPAPTGASVTLSSAVQDSKNLQWKWDFGDGSPTSNTPGSTTHLYSAPGTYTASLVVSDEGAFVKQDIAITIVPASGTVPPGELDDDGDGFSNEIETLLSTNAHDAYSVPFTGGAAALTVTFLDIKLNFRKPNSDALLLKGVLPLPEGFSTQGQSVLLDIGGRILTFALDAKGTAAAGKKGSLKLSPKGKTRGAFALSLKNIALREALADEGLTGTVNVTGAQASVPITVIFNQHMLRNIRNMTYSAIQNVKGEAKDLKTAK